MKHDNQKQKVIVILVLPKDMYLPGAKMNHLSQLCLNKANEVVKKLGSSSIYEPVFMQIILCGSILPLSCHIDKIVEEIFRRPDDHIDGPNLKRIFFQIISPSFLSKVISKYLSTSFAISAEKCRLKCGGKATLEASHYEISAVESLHLSLKRTLIAIWNGEY